MGGSSDNREPIEDVVIARVVKARGIRGEVACDLETDFPERFETMDEATLWMADGTRRRLAVEDAWFHQGRVILKFAGVDTRNDAQRLIGARLVIAESDARPLDEDEFFEYQLVGCDVITVEGRRLGRVARLLRTGGTDVLVVADDARELMIPFADEICPEVDVEARRITVDPPEGLLDL